MAAIHSCPNCPLCQQGRNLAELAQLRKTHQDIHHAGLTRSDDSGQRAGR